MVKFSKQFEGQLVPEWKEAFVDYLKLKKCLKNIHLLHTNPNTNHHHSFFSCLKKKISLFGHPQRQHHHGAIQVHKKLASSGSRSDMYETELMEQFADTEAAKDFFTCLDLQLNKVNQFFKSKEKEFMDRADSLREQIQILIHLKSALQQNRGERAQQGLKLEEEEDPSITCTISCEEEVQENVKLRTVSSGGVFKCNGKSLKIKIPMTNPTRTLSAISYFFKGDSANSSSKKGDGGKLHINKTKLNHAEKMIRGAFSELYKGLGYLKTYKNLNMLAFMKILKKFDKVTGKQVLPIYLKVVETSYFNSSDKVMSLTDEVEEVFTKHFAEDDKRKAMKYLKPHHRKESHAVTYFTGLFSGCFVALLAGYVTMAHSTGMYTQQSDTLYMETIYPLLSMFSLLFLHFFLYGCNIFMWRKARINYSFIFELSQTKELKYRDVFLICTASMSLVVGVMFVHLILIARGYSYSQVRAIPSVLLLVFLLVLVCPFEVFYRSSRFRFLCAVRNTVLSPLYKVVMTDFFLADQMCSQVPMLRNLEYVACYYITGSYKTEDYGYCMRATHYKDLAYAVSFLPYYWRAMQCARRWFDEGEKGHLLNLGKYVSAMLAAGARVAYEREKSVGWLSLLVVMSSGATVYQLYWDFVRDWGLLQPDSKNPWLRDDLVLRRKIVYYFSMGLNIVLRLAWLQTVLHSSFENVDYRVTGLFLAALEVIRRGQWNFYRLENEHLNNAGKFRAVKTVPLPFHEVDDEDC